MNLFPFTIGLTGGIGSGKTVVTDWFAEQGIDIIDADVIAHQSVAKGSPTLQEIATTFGQWVIKDDGTLHRRRLREIVFASDEALQKLESITHPAIRHEAHLQLMNAKSDYIIISAPLLFESAKAGLLGLCDHLVVVDVKESLQLARASKRDKRSEEHIQAVMNKQLTRQERISKADDIIYNNGTLEELYRELEKFHQKFLNLAHNASF